MLYPPWTTFLCIKSEGECPLTFWHHITSLISSLGMQIDPCISFQHIAKAFLVCRQHGQAGNTTAIAHCHQTLWPKCGGLSQ